jgi:hypothetical protein
VEQYDKPRTENRHKRTKRKRLEECINRLPSSKFGAFYGLFFGIYAKRLDFGVELSIISRFSTNFLIIVQ